MRVTILGSGTAVPSAERFPAGVLVEGGGVRVVVDLGPGVLRRLAAVGVAPESVDAVLLTHYHVDHCADVAALLFALHAPDTTRPPLRIVGGPGLGRFLAGLRAAWPGWLEPRGYELREHEIAPGPFAVGGLEVTAHAIAHTAASLAYRLHEPETGAVAAISGDATPCAGLVDVARGAHLFVCESAFPDAAPRAGHLTPRLAGEAAAAAGVATLCLTHFYPACEGHDVAAEARRVFGGRVVAAHDLLRLELP